jgi:hypothetical protein
MINQTEDRHGNTPLAIAAMGNRSFNVKDRMSVIRRLIKAGADVNRPCNAKGLLPLCIAVEDGPENEEVVSLLLRRLSGDDKTTAKHKDLALYHAVQKPGNEKIVRLLLNAGAGNDFEAHRNAINTHSEVLPLLYHDLAAKTKGKEPGMLLNLASAMGDTKKVEDLLPRVEDAFPTNIAFHVGIALILAGNDKTLDWLLSYAINAAPDARRAIFKLAALMAKTSSPQPDDQSWCRRLSWAAFRRPPETAVMLLNLLCDVIRSCDRLSFLCAIVESGSLAALKILLSRLPLPTT